MSQVVRSPPRIPELLFAAVLIWLFATGQGWSVLLADGDTGWHIRNGEQIIATRTVPHTDAFAFGGEGHPWFAWEWLSDVLFAALFRTGGLRSVSVFCGIVIAASVSILFRHLAWRSVGVCIALPLTLLGVGASSVHYLARPHVLGLLFFVVTAWMIDRERTGPRRASWTLVLVFLLWANCHGSFLAGLAMLGLSTGERAVGAWKNWPCSARGTLARPALILALSSGATLCNPYGWHLHAHALAYLRSGWIQATIEEFQSPRFRSENMFQFELLLIMGLSALPWLFRRRQLYPLCVILLWTHASLASVRHVPLYCLAAVPFTGSWLQHVWSMSLRRYRPESVFAAFDSTNRLWKPWISGASIWPALLCVLIWSTATASEQSLGFPANKFPVGIVERNLSRLTSPSGPPLRILSSDQWSDYLIFRVYPSVRIYFDGRSDFFGSWRGQAYLQLMAGQPGALAILDREDIDTALLPKDWALSGILRSEPGWKMTDCDEQAILFVREPRKTVLHPNQNMQGRR